MHGGSNDTTYLIDSIHKIHKTEKVLISEYSGGDRLPLLTNETFAVALTLVPRSPRAGMIWQNGIPTTKLKS